MPEGPDRQVVMRWEGGFAPAGAIQILAVAGVLATGAGALIQTNQARAMTNAVELVRLAHATARTTALRTGEAVRMDVVEEGSSIRVALVGDAERESGVVREVAPPAVAIESEFETICYDGLGTPMVGGDCGEQSGSIVIRTLTGESTLTLNGEGRLDAR